MRTIFADAGYWIALLNPKDDLHDKAVSVSSSLGWVTLITTEMVLTELLNAFAEQGTKFRNLSAWLVQRLRQDANTRIVAQSSAQFDEALQLYQDRPDKEWGHTDCASFCVMEKESIAEVLTHDHHFEQAGFKALMRP